MKVNMSSPATPSQNRLVNSKHTQVVGSLGTYTLSIPFPQYQMKNQPQVGQALKSFSIPDSLADEDPS